MQSNIISLTTDFGLKDPYVAEMKATILDICPKAIIIDITHQIQKFNIRMAAYTLSSASPYFPKGTIHVAVVDPGVGTKRTPIVIQTRRGFFVGPDNGLLVLAAEQQGIERIHTLANSRFMLPRPSNTFHGRDIFAPAAAHLLKGIKLDDFGPNILEIVKPNFTKPSHHKGSLLGEVLHVDDFGNIITNIHGMENRQILNRDSVAIKIADHQLKAKVCKAYGEGELHELLILVGSHGFIEIALNQDSAAKKFEAKNGDEVVLSHL